jgi:hypothetical protein
MISAVQARKLYRPAMPEFEMTRLRDMLGQALQDNAIQNLLRDPIEQAFRNVAVSHGLVNPQAGYDDFILDFMTNDEFDWLDPALKDRPSH